MTVIKKLLGPVSLVLLTILVILIGREAYNAYMVNHNYYYAMINNRTHWKLILLFALISLVPLRLLFKTHVFRSKTLGWSFLATMFVGGFIHVINKGGLVEITGTLIYSFNLLVLLTLIVVFVGGLYAGGSIVYKRYIKPELLSRADHVLAFGLGLGIFLLLNYVLIVLQLFFPVFARLQFFAFIYLIWSQKLLWRQTGIFLAQEVVHLRALPQHVKVVIGILLGLSIIYMLFGFNLSFIPYSTAWDANHAYMYYPKVWALNNGLFFSQGPVTTPYLWMAYISYWFSLFKPFASRFTLAPDTIAVVLNNLSGWFSLVFGVVAISRVVAYFRDNNFISSDRQAQYALCFGRGSLLLWLMSGMGAFLVFVDNKTDLGVMSLTLLALIAGFQLIGLLKKAPSAPISRNISHHIPVLLSSFFFALAVLSKPTAFQDVVIFVLLYTGIFVGIAGVVGIFLIVLAILGKAQAMSMVFYVSKSLATTLGLLGLALIGMQGLMTWRKNIAHRLQSLLYRSLGILALLLLVKGSYLATYQVINKDFSVQGIVKGILLGKTDHSQQNQNTLGSINFLADTNTGTTIASNTGAPDIKTEYCSLSSAGLTSDNLYDNLEPIEGGGLIEDLGRYIGYEQRLFTHPASRSESEKKSYGSIHLGYWFARTLFPLKGCYSFNYSADRLCEDTSLRSSPQELLNIKNQLTTGSQQFLFLSEIIEDTEKLQTLKQEELSGARQQLDQKIRTYVTSNVVQVFDDQKGYRAIAIPYAYLTPLNVIFNRSLQNHSSYYTDIGFVWILSLLLLLAGTIASIFYRNKDLLVLHLVAVAGWILWWFLASGIIRYAVGIIVRTTLCNALFVSRLLTQQQSSLTKWSTKIIIGVLIVGASVQTIFNMTRIASQGSGGPFTWYKGGVGTETQFLFNNTGNFGPQEVVNYRYRAKDVFDLQFGQYNPFIKATQDRPNKQGVLIAGTYIQYFLGNQHNIYSDGLLTSLWQRGSDENTCNLALRLQDKNLHYLVIDPNIGSVVMGEGNASLFERFFAKIDPDSHEIVSNGTMTMIVKMIDDGYLKLFNTNHIGAKYAYTLTPQELEQAIEQIPDQDMKTRLLTALTSDSVLFRAKLAVPRFFPQEANDYFALIGYLFQSRLTNELGVSDIAAMLGKDVDMAKVLKAITLLENPPQGANLRKLNTELSNDERTVVGYYLILLSKLKSNDMAALQDIINQLLQNSVISGSQVIIFELTL